MCLVQFTVQKEKSCATTEMDLETIMLSEISQLADAKNLMISLICVI